VLIFTLILSSSAVNSSLLSFNLRLQQLLQHSSTGGVPHAKLAQAPEAHASALAVQAKQSFMVSLVRTRRPEIRHASRHSGTPTETSPAR
jgi:hypothetical protein